MGNSICIGMKIGSLFYGNEMKFLYWRKEFHATKNWPEILSSMGVTQIPPKTICLFCTQVGKFPLVNTRRNKQFIFPLQVLYKEDIILPHIFEKHDIINQGYPNFFNIPIILIALIFFLLGVGGFCPSCGVLSRI